MQEVNKKICFVPVKEWEERMMTRWTGKEDVEYLKEEERKEIKGYNNGREGLWELF